MEVQQTRPLPALRRCYQCCRHAEQVLTLAYEQVFPQTRQLMRVQRTNKKAVSAERRVAARRA